MIHPFLRRADGAGSGSRVSNSDSSLHTKGRQRCVLILPGNDRLIPSYEGQTRVHHNNAAAAAIHPFLQRADASDIVTDEITADSSLLTKGRHSFFLC